MTTLIILNPHAGSGRAGKLWSKIEPLLWQELGELVIAVTQHPEEVATHLDKARAAGLTRVIAIGGDGTNHALVNELIRLNRSDPSGPQMTFGCLPIGTGRDWARTLGIPFTPADAVRWIKSAHPSPLDAGELVTEQANGATATRHFLNIASVGISGMITSQINQLIERRPWTFYRATVEALLRYRPPHMTIRLDGMLWYEGEAYIVAIANGRTFGHGMKIAPNADYGDGMFDVVLVEGMPRTRILAALNTVYSGTHLKRSDVHIQRARVAEVECSGGSVGPLSLELDGENAVGNKLRFEVLPGALSTLTKPSLLV
jgi:YegS/Rv2252/BmrU family lipid kinase